MTYATEAYASPNRLEQKSNRYPLGDVAVNFKPWWRHQMETFSALLAICAGNSPVPGEFPAQRPATRIFVFS